MSNSLHYNYSPDPVSPQATKPLAVVIFLPTELDEMIQPAREKYDPDVSLIAGHLSIVLPFLTDKTLLEVSGIIRQEIDRLDPLELTLETVGDFYPTLPIISWTVRHHPQMQELYLNLHALIGLPLPHKGFFPHVPIAREISNHRLVMVKEKLLAYACEASFTPEAVDLISPVSEGKWVSVRTFVLPKG